VDHVAERWREVRALASRVRVFVVEEGRSDFRVAFFSLTVGRSSSTRSRFTGDRQSAVFRYRFEICASFAAVKKVSPAPNRASLKNAHESKFPESAGKQNYRTT
jgi:hypothetical protein